MTDRADYRSIVAHYEECLERYGDEPRGVDWPNAADAGTRYAVMLDVVEADATEPIVLLDFGCGAAHLLDYVGRRRWRPSRYIGLDLSQRFVDLCRSKYPEHEFICGDVLESPELLPDYDYAVMNGVFTEKLTLPDGEMFAYLQSLVTTVFAKARRGIAFNVMSSHVDWTREDLFHVPFEDLTAFLVAEVSRHFVIRHDYGLHEYTVYVYRGPNVAPAGSR